MYIIASPAPAIFISWEAMLRLRRAFHDAEYLGVPLLSRAHFNVVSG